MVGMKTRGALLCTLLMIVAACGTGVADESVAIDPAHAGKRDQTAQTSERSKKVIRVPDTSNWDRRGSHRHRYRTRPAARSTTATTVGGQTATTATTQATQPPAPGDSTTVTTAPAVNTGGGGTATTATTSPPSTTASTAATTRPTSPPSPAPAPAPAPPAGSVMFSEDFNGAGSLTGLDVGLFHRDDFLVSDTQWPGDHAITGPNDLCGAPTETRTVSRGNRSSGFNKEWIYRCVPGGDVAKSHIMTSIGDTSGYSIGAFAPKQSFTGVREIRWDVNLTDLGLRQWTEVAVIPAGKFNIQNLPCLDLFPCDTTTHGSLGSVGTSFFNHEMVIANRGSESNGSSWSDGRDPALSSKAIRRTHIFRDNGNGTLSFSIQREDGSFQTVTSSGSFPTGPVRVVFTDHNYTPEKGNDPVGFSWHWDNLVVAG